MAWIIFAVLGIAVLAIFFIILTDGRYFGKKIIFRIYEQLGPAIFSAHSEAERWLALAEILQLRGDEAILDVGTAIGDLPLTMASRHGFSGQATGIDWSPQMIARATAEADRRGLRERAKFSVVDVRQRLPFDDSVFDIVTCFGLLETLPQPEQILVELTRVLKPNGVLALSLYKGWSARSAALSLNWYQQRLALLGLSSLEIIPLRRNQDVIIAQFNG